MIRPFIAILAVSTILIGTAVADTRWNLTKADFQSRQVTLQGIDDKTVRYTEGSEERTVPLDQFVSVELPVQATRPPQGKFRLVLAGGNSLTGEPVEVKDENLTFASALLGQVTLPLKQVTRLESIVRAPQARKVEASATEDIVLMANGDNVRGFVQQVTPAAIVVKGADGPTDVPADSVAVVHFAATAAPSDKADRGFRIRVEDGSWISVDSLAVAGSTVTARFAAGEPRQFETAKLLAIEQVNGPVSWLSSRTPSQSVQTPFLDVAWPARMDRNVSGEPIRFGQKTFAHGIGVHSASKITWPLDGSYKHFRTQYAIDGRLPYADVDVRVLLDGKVVHESRGFKAGVLSPVVSVDLADAKSITLEVGFGAGYDVQDRFNWIEPALLRSAPAAAPATQPQ